MNENKKEYKINYGGKEITIETGRLAKQADGAVLVSCNGTQVLVAVNSARELKDGQDFFPLLVEYQEKFYAAGKFLGGFIKRENRPSTAEILACRLIDRPLRPMFPSDYMFDTVVTCSVLSYNEAGDAEVLAGLGASAAIAISDIPFAAPIGNAKVARIGGIFVLNPNHSEWANSDLEIAVSGSKEAILMVEGEAQVVPEKDILAAINFAHDNIKSYCDLVAKMQKEIGKPKRKYVSAEANVTLSAKVQKDFTSVARAALSINDKMQRQEAVRALNKSVAEAIKADPASFGLKDDKGASKEAYKAVDGLMYDMMRADILNEGKRIAGRGLDEVRKIETEVSVLNAPHGSSLFTRGETQVMATVTVGASVGDQMHDRISGLTYDKFYLHYNFPGFSVGEAKGSRGAGRRELGHGNLAERALKAVMPSQETFSYTTRVVCEVLESNGSSSMGSVCSGSMALMDAGVPIVSPVAGIAMGLITDGAKYKVLTDILGDEDHLGDLDFKVAGTKDGVTAIQMDIKITGLTPQIIEEAIGQAYKGRMHILGEMAKTISTPRDGFKPGVPTIMTVMIPTDKIGALIGPGGKNIKKLQEGFKVTIEITEEGMVKVLGSDMEVLKTAIATINMQINGPEIGSVYEARVDSIKEYGAFVEIGNGVSGLVHVSEMSDERVQNPADFISEGDMIKVKVVEIDKMGRIKLSAKAVQSLKKKEGK
ncbi:MAG: polyribonucleotide nucleotidyltransferase [Bdellovibrionales bacterium]|nr:polyribonucleotide nucleotidyltransferase [Bdellovibrionales bacterium]